MTNQVRMFMTPHPSVIEKNCTLMQAAQKMEEIGCGVLPVGSDENIEGIITDRDIVIRAISKGKDVNAEKVGPYMTTNICYCKESDTLETAANLMHQNGVGRLLVKDTRGTFCGIITFGSILRKDRNEKEIGEIVERAVGRKAA